MSGNQNFHNLAQRSLQPYTKIISTRTSVPQLSVQPCWSHLVVIPVAKNVSSKISHTAVYLLIVPLKASPGLNLLAGCARGVLRHVRSRGSAALLTPTLVFGDFASNYYLG